MGQFSLEDRPDDPPLDTDELLRRAIDATRALAASACELTPAARMEQVRCTRQRVA